jgi:CubicO group peptidase (beta-lactamase class C family)
MKKTQPMNALPLLALVCIPALAAELNGVAVTGIDAPAMASFDHYITALMHKYQIPGGAVAVAKDGKLVLAHGYGMADVEAHQAVAPDSLFRVASISKPFTAVAVLKLVEQGKLHLDDKPFAMLHFEPPPGKTSDPRLRTITIRELLQHSGGWDRNKSFDPMFIPIKAAQAVGAPAPASCETIIRYMLGETLQFDPGTAYAYSNFGYCVLGRVIEKVAGQRYEDYVRTAVLVPMQIRRMRIGHSLPEQRANGEVKYYDFPDAPQVQSVFPNRPGTVPRPYGGWNLEAMDSHGAWIASAIDLVRFMLHVDGHLQPAPLQTSTARMMIAAPGKPIQTDPQTWYGLGWQVRKVGDDANWWHTGSLDGTNTIMVRTSKNMHWAALFNSRPRSNQFQNDLDSDLWKAAGEVGEWPQRDLFERYR